MFADPDRFDLQRANANRHLAFVVGAHHCLGSALARLEGQLAFRRALERLPTLKRAGQSVRRPHLVARGMINVPLVSPS
jgi:cytochrome P450